MKQVLLNLYAHEKDTKTLCEFLDTCIKVRILILGGKNFRKETREEIEKMNMIADNLGFTEEEKIEINKSLLKFRKEELIELCSYVKEHFN